MAYVTSRKLKEEIMRNFRQFLMQKVRDNPDRKDYAELLTRLKD